MTLKNITLETYEMKNSLPELESEPIVIIFSEKIDIYFNLTNKNGFFFAGAVAINTVINEPSRI